MKIQCDVCQKKEATVFCAADEAALCECCDHKVHHANKLAGKHPRFPLLHPSFKDAPRCDICQERRAFLFCREDRAILCRECDVSIHGVNEHTQRHSRFLLTGVKLSVAASSSSVLHRQASSSSSTGHRSAESNTASELSNFRDLFRQPSSNSFTTPSPMNNNGQYTSEEGSISTITEFFAEFPAAAAGGGWRLEDFVESSSAANHHHHQRHSFYY